MISRAAATIRTKYARSHTATTRLAAGDSPLRTNSIIRVRTVSLAPVKHMKAGPMNAYSTAIQRYNAPHDGGSFVSSASENVRYDALRDCSFGICCTWARVSKEPSMQPTQMRNVNKP